jgi:hypothetical protein
MRQEIRPLWAKRRFYTISAPAMTMRPTPNREDVLALSFRIFFAFNNVKWRASFSDIRLISITIRKPQAGLFATDYGIHPVPVSKYAICSTCVFMRWWLFSMHLNGICGSWGLPSRPSHKRCHSTWWNEQPKTFTRQLDLWKPVTAITNRDYFSGTLSSKDSPS